MRGLRPLSFSPHTVARELPRRRSHARPCRHRRAPDLHARATRCRRRCPRTPHRRHRRSHIAALATHYSYLTETAGSAGRLHRTCARQLPRSPGHRRACLAPSRPRDAREPAATARGGPQRLRRSQHRSGSARLLAALPLGRRLGTACRRRRARQRTNHRRARGHLVGARAGGAERWRRLASPADRRWLDAMVDDTNTLPGLRTAIQHALAPAPNATASTGGASDAPEATPPDDPNIPPPRLDQRHDRTRLCRFARSACSIASMGCPRGRGRSAFSSATTARGNVSTPTVTPSIAPGVRGPDRARRLTSARRRYHARLARTISSEVNL